MQVYTPDLFQAVPATAPSLMARGHCEPRPTYLPGFSNRTEAFLDPCPDWEAVRLLCDLMSIST